MLNNDAVFLQRSMLNKRNANLQITLFKPAHLWAITAVCILFFVFWPLLQAGYILTFDDNRHFFYNPLVRSGSFSAVWPIFTSPDSVNKTFIPLTILTFLYENILFKLNPHVSHFINIILHGSVCVLIYLFARCISLSKSVAYLSAVFFMVHPMHVEPVAWITARKDLLYSFFYMASLILYSRYAESGRTTNYIFALAAAGLSVLSKPMALSLPFSLFLVDFIQSRSFSWKSLWEKVPFLFVVEPVALITYFMNARTIHVSLLHALLLYIWSASFYIQKFLCPAGLSVIYPVPFPVSLSNPDYIRAILFLLLWVLLLWRFRAHRLVLFSAAWYMISLFFIWRIDIYDINFVADRFMYLPSLGFCFLVGFCLQRAIASKKNFNYLWPGFIFILFTLTACLRVPIWDNSFRLWRNALVQSDLPIVWASLGESVFFNGSFASTERDYVRYIASSMHSTPQRIKEIYPLTFANKILSCREIFFINANKHAVSLDSRYLRSWVNLGLAYDQLGAYEKAVKIYDHSIALGEQPLWNLFYNRAKDHDLLHNNAKAERDYSIVIASEPKLAEPYIYRARLLLLRGKIDLALNDAIMAWKLAPRREETKWLLLLISKNISDPKMVGLIKALLMDEFSGT